MEEALSFREAWQAFYDGNENPPSEADFSRAQAAVEFLGAESFVLTENYITDVAHAVHVNVGFLLSKESFPGGLDDDVYKKEGFLFRLWFTNSGSGGGTGGGYEVRKVLCPTSFIRVNPGVKCDYCEMIHTPE